MKNYKFLLLKLSLIILILSPFTSNADKSVWDQMSADQIIATADNIHPAALYVLAMKLFGKGDKEEAVFWYYAGQLRYRFHLASSKDLDPSGDPALFGSFSETIGRPINEYAFGNITELSKTIDRVIEWDKKTDNKFTSKSKHKDIHQGIVTGLADLKTHIQTNKSQIYSDRIKNGLTNRE